MSKVIELPVGKRTKLYRFFEILPGLLSTLAILLLVILSAISSVWGSVYLLLIVITSVVRAIVFCVNTIRGYNVLKSGIEVNWRKRVESLENPRESYSKIAHQKESSYNFKEYKRNLCMVAAAEDGYFPKPSEIYHAIIVTAYNETYDILEPTIDSILKSSFPKERMMLVLAYEERGGLEMEQTAKEIEKKYAKDFGHFLLAKHPDGIKNEVIGKGGNITNAGRMLAEYVKKAGIQYKNVIVTTLDSDNKPHVCYFDQVAYEFIVHEDRKHLSYQPISIFTNNIWDAPAVTRIIANTNSFWNLICTMRPHTLRNFASHSQPLDALVEMNFWSVRTIVEDGHQYWRSLFYFDGKYDVVPIRAPIYQDAVLNNSLWKTLRAQWIQLRRWDYGASDVAYVGDYIFSSKRTMRLRDILPKFIRLIDGNITLAAISPIVAFGGWIPLIFNIESRDLISHNLPQIVSYVQTFATCMLIVTIALSVKMLPERPKRYKKTRAFAMVFQWVISPVLAIIYTSSCAFYSQYRLMLGKYMEKFDVTQKIVKK